MMTKRLIALLLGFTVLTSISSWGQSKAATSKDKRGLLPELQMKPGQSENTSEAQAMSAEILITRTENKAIDALLNILKKKSGTPEEADLLYRLAELYMRRSKSGRFFDVHQGFKSNQLSSFPIPSEKGTDAIRKAVEIYNKIEAKFKNYREMDSVLFNNAFAHQQLRLLNVSESLYKKMINNYPSSSMIADGILALSELLYDQQKFSDAITYFKKLEAYPESKVYSYGMYKMAWTYYNLKDSDSGVQKLLEVVKLNPANTENTKSYNLRKEALRDLTIFVGDAVGTKGLYSFFVKITTEEELGQAILDLAKLYDSHSRFKDMPIFVNEFNQKHPTHPLVVKTNLILVNSFEILKQREDVLANLKVASELCHPDSEWRKAQTPENLEESCQHKFREESLEISKKWWEIWTKNKSHKEFSSLTERALRLILDDDDAKAPDFKTRYALAELLFQNEKFEESGRQYMRVAETTTEKPMGHDAAYAALFSIEKALEKNTDKTPANQKNENENLRKKYVQYYMAKYPDGEFILPIQFKWSLIQYNENQWAEAEKTLNPLIVQKADVDIKGKSEDLLLDIYNIRKDFTGLKNKAKEFLHEAETTGHTGARQKNLNKIYEDAHYSEVQNLSEKGQKLQAAQALMQFTTEHPDSKMKNEAEWQALSLYYSEGYLKEASDLSLEFVKKNPNDKRALDALKEAVNSKIELGQLAEASEILKKLTVADSAHAETYWVRAAQFYWLEGQKSEARKIYGQLLKKAGSSQQKNEYQNLMISSFTEEEKSSSEYNSFIQSLVDQGIEPYATKSLTEKATRLVQNGKRSEAFELARKIMSRDTDSGLRAPARMIQAQILEDEFISQSVKSSTEDRLTLVISLKSEKMEKALSSYLSVLKMSETPDLQVKALQGVDRIYGNYISSLSDMRGPASLSENDLASIKKEISKALDPIREKQIDNKKQIEQLQSKVSVSSDKAWDVLPASDFPQNQLTYFPADKLHLYLPQAWETSTQSKSEFKSTKTKCEVFDPLKVTEISEQLKMTSNCALIPGTKVLLNNVNHLLDNPKTRAFGLFYLSVLSEKQGLYEKAFWASEKSLQNLKNINGYETDSFFFQRLRMKIRTQGWNAASSDFDKIFELKISSPQIETLKSFQLFKTSQFEKTTQILSQLPSEDLYTLNGVLVLSESYCKKGDFDKGLSTVRKSKLSKTAEGLIQIGRIFEYYKPNVSEAQEAYLQASKVTSDEAQKKWLERKLEYLKGLNKVSQI